VVEEVAEALVGAVVDSGADDSDGGWEGESSVAGTNAAARVRGAVATPDTTVPAASADASTVLPVGVAAREAIVAGTDATWTCASLARLQNSLQAAEKGAKTTVA
jgi:hypothetical protein